jgi:DNA polymerase III subunit epsilon
MIVTDIEKYAALDFEASSLSSSSWPIEVGVSWVEADRVQTWSSLIQPHPNWDLTDWSIQSEGVHHIPLADLQNAPPAPRVAQEVLSVASELILVSDAPAFEHRWLSRLLEAADLGPGPTIEDYNTVSFACFDGLALDMLYEKLERTRVPHRAGPDSARLASGWLKARSVDASKI